MGAGAAKRLSAVRWGVAGNIVVAWVLTLPGGGDRGALAYGVDPDLRHRRDRARSSSRRGDPRGRSGCSATAPGTATATAAAPA